MKKERGLALAACAALAALMLLFASQCSPLYPINLWDDANCLLTVGRVMRRGGVLYRDIYEQKGPLLYLIHALAACISDTSFWGVYALEIPALTAALYAARANLSVRIVEKEVCGGLVNWTHTVENVPSYKSIHGMDLMTACREHVESLGVAIEEVNEVEEVRLDGQPKEIRTSEGDSFTADVVIIATGRKPIPLPVETAFEKVHYCSVCDGTAYKDKDVLVVGGGNSGFDESLYLAGLGVRSVHIVEMFPACAAAQSTQDRALATGIIRANVNTTITALDPLPDGRCRASLRDTASGAASEETVDGVFCFIGQKPNTALLEGLIDMEKGYIRTDEDMRTSLPGVFAVGDVRAKRYRQITTAMGDGTIAALEAERFIRSLR